MERILKELEYCRDNEKIVSVHLRASSADSFLTGYVAACNKTRLLMAAVSERGEYDGFMILKISDIFHIHYDGIYEGKIALLYSLKEQKHPELPVEDGRIVGDFLAYAKKEQVMVTFEVGAGEACEILSGTITDYDERYIKLECYNSYGYPEGSNLVEFRMVQIICADTEDEQDLELLVHSEDR